MVSKKIRNLIIGIGLLYMLTFGNFIAKAAGLNGQYILPQSSITYVQKVEKVDKVQCVKSVQTIGKTTITYNKSIVQNKGKILIYHTHTCEKNLNSNVVDVGNDLGNKLRSLGYEVDNVNTDFIQGDYNNAYYHSGVMLQQKDLKSYDLTIDLHFDASPSPIVTKVKGENVSSLMFVTTSQNRYLQQETNIINRIKTNMDQFSTKIVRDQTTHYKKGIDFYELNRSPNMLLVEVGGDKNTYQECQLSNTYLATSINNYIMNK